jgi:hypothetical protein
LEHIADSHIELLMFKFVANKNKEGILYVLKISFLMCIKIP